MVLEKKFIKALKKHDRKAQNELYKKCFNILMSISIRYRKSPDDAAFLVNEAFIKILKHINTIDHTSSIVPWIKRIMINTAIDDFRKNQKHNLLIHLDSSSTENQHAVSTDPNIEFETAEYFQHLLNQIPRATANVFNLYAIDGYSHKEISKMLEISAETSKWHVKQARKKLKELYTIKLNKEVG